jgi:glutaminase
MFDYSGEWVYYNLLKAQTIGLPAKSSLTGCVFVVVPHICGFSVYSPPLDSNNISKKSKNFIELLVEKFKWNIFDVIFSQ